MYLNKLNKKKIVICTNINQIINFFHMKKRIINYVQETDKLLESNQKLTKEDLETCSYMRR